MNYYNEIKEILVNNEITKRIKDYSKNKSDLDSYYRVGKLLVEAQGGEKRAKYGDNLIKEYSKKLTLELGKGYSTRSLKYMRKFYLFQKGQALPAQLTWSHYCELLSIDDMNKINYYIDLSLEQGLSYRKLHERIKSNEYERLPIETKNKLIFEEKVEVKDLIPNPILIENKYAGDHISEKVLKRLLLENIPQFLEQLGNGFSFIKDEYKIKLGDKYNYIDILLFNYKYNCFVVIELKVTELKKEHIGQIQIYMNYVDKNIKNINQDKTKNNKYVIEYCSDDRIISREYMFI